MIIWLASGSIHKKNELCAILSNAVNEAAPHEQKEIILKMPSEAGFEFDPEETGNSFLENAYIKAAALYRLLSRETAMPQNYMVIADDSGICVDALGGRPGIFSARYSGPGGVKVGGANHVGAKLGGVKIGDDEKNALLLKELGDNPNRSARFVCAMVLCYGQERCAAVQETLEGELVRGAPRGSGGFGYDPILYIPELGRTVAELSAEEKNLYSHRGKAGKALGRILAAMN